ncbi:MAG: conjugal transfer protein TrbL [Proteobacteria bacterium HN_bin10]|nr:MAG: conjugal transfer protein TrbL [Proteobacteria bacterium HN_bin10]
MPVTSGVSNDLMTVFSNTVSAGFANITGAVNGLFGIMIVLTVALTGIYWALSDNRASLAAGFSKILLIGFFAYLINDWQGLSETLYAGFIELGLLAGGSSLTASDFLNPGKIIETGWEIVRAIGESPQNASSALDVLGNMVDALIFAFAMLGIMIAFAILAIQIVVALLEFKIVTLAGFVLLPFGIWSKSAFLAERPLGYVISAGLKILALAIIVSGAQAVFDQLMPSPGADIYEALTVLTAALMLAMLAIFIPNLAASLITGGPNLGAGAAITSGILMAGAGGLAAYGAGRALGASFGAMRSIAGGMAQTTRAAAGAISGPRGGSGPNLPPPPKSPPPTPPASSGGSGANSPPSRTPSSPAGSNASPSGAGGASAPAASSTSSSASPPLSGAATVSAPGARRKTPRAKRQDQALRAFLVANTARQLLPSQEHSGSLPPNLKKED